MVIHNTLLALDAGTKAFTGTTRSSASYLNGSNAALANDAVTINDAYAGRYDWSYKNKRWTLHWR